MFFKTSIMSALSVAALGGALLASPTAEARSPQGKAKHQRGDRVERLCKLVECTDAQQAKLTKIHDSAKEDFQKSRAKQKDLRERIAAESNKKNPSDKKIERLREQMKNNREATKAQRERVKGQVAKVLTDEQERKLKKAMAKRANKRGDNKGKRPHAGKKGKRGDRHASNQCGPRGKDAKPGQRHAKGKKGKKGNQAKWARSGQ